MYTFETQMAFCVYIYIPKQNFEMLEYFLIKNEKIKIFQQRTEQGTETLIKFNK